MGIKIQKRKFIRNIFIGIIALLIVAYIINIAPGYKRDKFKDVTNLVIGEKNVTENLKHPIYIDEGGVIYLSKEDIKEFLDKTIYFDEEDDLLITSSPISVASMKVGDKTIRVNDATNDTLYTIIYQDNIMYIPIDEIKSVYNIEIKYIKSNNTLIIDNLNEGMIKARVDENTKIRYKQRSLSKEVGSLEIGDTVSAFYTTSKGWRQIRTENGTVGYVKANVLTDEYILRQDMEQRPETKEITAKITDNSKINIERRENINKGFV